MLVALLVLSLPLVLAACGTTTTAGAAATSTTAAQATATVTAQPVALTVQLTQRGTVAANDVQLIATATIANRTNAPIHLAGSVCFVDSAHTTGGLPDGRPATIGLQVDNTSTQQTIWFSWGLIQCFGGLPAVDVQEVPADGTFTATLTCNLGSGFVPPGVALRAGIPYTIRVTIFFWHQGTADQFNQALYHPDQPGVLWDRNLTFELPFTFR